MGTRGLYAYRYRRRYYTTYNHMDSYPSGLGNDLVATIPADPAKFQQWLEKMKRSLETKYKAGRPGMEMLKSSKSRPHSAPPYRMRAPTLDLFIEFTYVMDLDRMAFTVNEAVHLRLDALPRGNNGREWMRALSDTEHPARLPTLSLTVPGPDPRHLALYEAAGATPSLSPLSDADQFAFPTCGVLMNYFFRQLRFVYAPVLDCISQYEHCHPDFRALAQAVLSIATWGRFSMATKAFKPSYERQITSVEPSWAEFECDDDDTHFWHQSTLVLLSVDLSDEQRLRSAVGEVVELWRAADRRGKHSTAFIISLQSVVEVHVSDNAVTHSAPIELCGAATESQPPFSTSSHTPGFALLMHHFTPALPALDPDPQCGLPLEILERVFDLCDNATLSTLAVTTKALRTACLMRPRFHVGRHRLLYHVADNEFTALDERADTVPVVVGKVGCAVEGGLPGGHGYNLVLHTADRDCALVGLMGIRCIPKELGGAAAAVLNETPDTDWRRDRMGGD